MEQPRIAFVSLHTSPTAVPGTGDAGGMNVVELHQARELTALGFEVELITRRSDPELDEVTELGPGLTLRQIAAGPTEIVAKSAQEELIPVFGEGLARLAPRPDDRPPYDLVHSQHWMSGVAAMPVAQQWGVPHVQSYHSIAAQKVGLPLSEGEPPESPGRVDGEALAARQSDLLVAVSNAERATIIERCGAPPERVVVVLPGVDSELFRPLDDGDALWRDGIQPYLVFAARLQPLKAPDVVVKALAAMPVERRPRLVLAGDGSPDFPQYDQTLRQLVAEHGLGEHVIFVGSLVRDELAQLLRGAAAAVVPSYSETFGLIALEAAASGVPVVATRGSGGLEESVRDGVTGRLVESHDPQAWAEVLEELLGDEDSRAQLGRQAREFATQLTWRRSAQRLAVLYRDLLEVS